MCGQVVSIQLLVRVRTEVGCVRRCPADRSIALRQKQFPTDRPRPVSHIISIGERAKRQLSMRTIMKAIRIGYFNIRVPSYAFMLRLARRIATKKLLLR